MPNGTYAAFPALRPTILVQDVLKNVYRPSEMPPSRPNATERLLARETPRAA